MTNLLHQRCQTLAGGSPMGDAEIRSHLALVSGWQLKDGAIEKTFAFRNYHETTRFRERARPGSPTPKTTTRSCAVTYDRCVVRFDTHDVGGISINDFICAAKADALVSFVA